MSTELRTGAVTRALAAGALTMLGQALRQFGAGLAPLGGVLLLILQALPHIIMLLIEIADDD